MRSDLAVRCVAAFSWAVCVFHSVCMRVCECVCVGVCGSSCDRKRDQLSMNAVLDDDGQHWMTQSGPGNVGLVSLRVHVPAPSMNTGFQTIVVVVVVLVPFDVTRPTRFFPTCNPWAVTYQDVIRYSRHVNGDPIHSSITNGCLKQG